LGTTGTRAGYGISYAWTGTTNGSEIKTSTDGSGTTGNGNFDNNAHKHNIATYKIYAWKRTA
jgi:hypothetical protein